MGQLVRALYGTRDAPLAWQNVVKEDMKTLGFEECKVTTGVFTHRVRDLRLVVHVDVFPASGEKGDLIWFKEEFAKTYELKVQVAGWESGDEKKLSFLGRTIRTTPDGVELEGGDKHVKLMEEEWDMTCHIQAPIS